MKTLTVKLVKQDKRILREVANLPREKPKRKLLNNLILALSTSYPDYVFTDYTLDNFSIQRRGEVINNVSRCLETLGMEVEGFIEKLWNALEAHINYTSDACEIYAPRDEVEPFYSILNRGVWAFCYLFYNPELKRIVVFKCGCSSAFMTAGGYDDEDAEEEDDYVPPGGDDDDDVVGAEGASVSTAASAAPAHAGSSPAARKHHGVSSGAGEAQTPKKRPRSTSISAAAAADGKDDDDALESGFEDEDEDDISSSDDGGDEDGAGSERASLGAARKDGIVSPVPTPASTQDEDEEEAEETEDFALHEPEDELGEEFDDELE